MGKKGRRKGKKAERGGRISEGKIASSLKGYKELSRRRRVGSKELDRLMRRGDKIVHLETTKTIVTKPKLEGYWDKYNQTRIATEAKELFVRGSKYTGPAKEFAKEKGIRIL